VKKEKARSVPSSAALPMQVGISTNFNKFCGCEALWDPWNATQTPEYERLKFQFNTTAIAELYRKVRLQACIKAYCVHFILFRAISPHEFVEIRQNSHKFPPSMHLGSLCIC
jgi:hypothetical protein